MTWIGTSIILCCHQLADGHLSNIRLHERQEDSQSSDLCNCEIVLWRLLGPDGMMYLTILHNVLLVCTAFWNKARANELVDQQSTVEKNARQAHQLFHICSLQCVSESCACW